jgi:glycosyltransferase involved in cell wall biosynthesis
VTSPPIVTAGAAASGASGTAATGAAARPAPSAPATGRDETVRIAYLMSRFPKISETFILFEMIAVEQAGGRVELYPLIRERAKAMHPEARPWLARMHYARSGAPAIWASNLRWLRERPGAYLRALRDVARGTVGSANFFFGGLATFAKAAHYARRMQADGVAHLHCHFASHPALAGLVIGRLTGIPWSFVAHGSDLHVERRMLDRKVAEAAFVVAISEFNRRVILDHCGHEHADKVVVLHCGVDTEVFRSVPRRTDVDVLQAVCVGTLHEVKGQANLLRAAATCRADGVEVAVTFIGDGPDRDALAALAAELGIGDRVTFVGPATRAEVVAHLEAADVLVAPSVVTAGGKREGIPVVLMEAMASGLPVVSSRLSGIPELVEDGVSGILTEPGDVAALATALAQLAGDAELRAAQGRAGRARVEAEFDLRGNAERLLALVGAGPR